MTNKMSGPKRIYREKEVGYPIQADPEVSSSLERREGASHYFLGTDILSLTGIDSLGTSGTRGPSWWQPAGINLWQ